MCFKNVVIVFIYVVVIVRGGRGVIGGIFRVFCVCGRGFRDI